MTYAPSDSAGMRPIALNVASTSATSSYGRRSAGIDGRSPSSARTETPRGPALTSRRSPSPWCSVICVERVGMAIRFLADVEPDEGQTEGRDPPQRVE